MKYTAIVNGKTYEVEIVRSGVSRSISHSAPAAPAYTAAPEAAAAAPAPAPAAPAAPAPAAPVNAAPAASGSDIVCPMPGKVLDIMVKPGDAVAAGQVVVMLEAMKMEIEVRADSAGVVSAIAVKKGDTVEGGMVLVKL